MIQENETLSVRVDMTYVGGRLNFQLFADKGVKPEMLRAMLVGGVALTIKAEEGPEKQGVAMKEVIDYLTSEFIQPIHLRMPSHIIGLNIFHCIY
jgi:hypothetical protein